MKISNYPPPKVGERFVYNLSSWKDVYFDILSIDSYRMVVQYSDFEQPSMIELGNFYRFLDKGGISRLG